MNELVLIVEDEASLAELLSYNLRKAGYRTAVADNGAQAIRIAHADAPDIVLLDIMLPEMDGWEVCGMLRSSRQGSTLPIIMMTALASEDIRIRGLRAGADDVIGKPFSPTELLFKIRKLLDKNMVIRTLRNKAEGQDASMRSLVHELRNSLTVIGGFTFLAAAKGDDEAWVRHVASAADRMKQTLNEAGGKSHIKAGGDNGGTEAC